MLTGLLALSWIDLALHQLWRDGSPYRGGPARAQGTYDFSRLLSSSSEEESDRDQSAGQQPRQKSASWTCLSWLPMVVVLSLHAFLEGLTIAGQSSVAALWVVTLSLGSHKWAVAMSMMTSFMQKQTDRVKVGTYLSILLTFSIMSPLGIAIGGLLFPSYDGNMSLTSLIISSLASGSLMYIMLFELLIPSAIEKQQRQIAFMTALSSGIILMSLFQLFTKEE